MVANIKNRPDTNNRAQRKKRIPVTGNRDLLTVSGKEDGYFYMWVNDVGTQIQRYKDGWYEPVQDDGSISVGTSSPTQLGGAVTATVDKRTGEKAVLMRIKNEYREEDLKAAQDRLEESKKSMLRQQEEEQGRYGKVEVA